MSLRVRFAVLFTVHRSLAHDLATVAAWPTGPERAVFHKQINGEASLQPLIQPQRQLTPQLHAQLDSSRIPGSRHLLHDLDISMKEASVEAYRVATLTTLDGTLRPRHLLA